MKKFIYIYAISILINLFCSCGGGSDAPNPEPENSAPSKPVLIAPTNGKLCIDNIVNFQWNISVDPEGDVISYLIQVATDNQFNQVAHTFSISATSKNVSLEKGIAYYWRVKATDSKNLASDYSSTFNFYTEGEINHIPFTPELITPELNSVIQTSTISLEWNANDVDTNDNLSYDVYFGEENPPLSKVGDNQTAKLLEVDLISSNNYYWRVIVKDNNGGESIGQVWNFKTD